MATTLAHPPPPSTAPPSVRLGGGSSLAQVRHLRDERGRRRRARWRANQDGMHNAATAVSEHNDGGGGGCGGGRPFTAAAGGYGRTTVNSGIVGGGCVEVKPARRRVSPRQRRRVEETHAYLCAKVDPVMGALILALVSDHPTNVHDAALRHLLFVSRKEKQDDSSTNKNGVASATAYQNDTSRLDKNNASNSRAAIGVPSPKYSVGTVESGRCSSDGGNGSGKGELNTGNGCKDKDSGSGTVGNAVGRLAQRRDRLFMAREIGPLVTELINRTLRHMPTDVESFLIEQLRGAVRTQTPEVSENFNESKTPLRSTGGSPLGSERHNDVYRSDHGGNITDNAKPVSPVATPRPSTARNRLQQAQDMDLAVQKSSPPQEDRTERRSCFQQAKPLLLCSRAIPSRARSPSPPRRPDLSTDTGDRVVAEGVRESRNKPWDVEVASKANLPPSRIEASMPAGTSATSSNKNPRLAVVLLLGIDGAGKTTLLGTLQGDHDPRVRPSVGFKPVTMMLSDQLKVKFYDLGGGKKIRSIWNNYFHDAHGVIYLVDGADRARWEESKEHFLVAMNHKHLSGKPVAVILNKEDAGLQLKPADVAEELGLSTQNTGKFSLVLPPRDKSDEVIIQEARSTALLGIQTLPQIWCCSANSARATGGMPDARLEGAVEWLLENVQENFPALNERVQRDLRDMEKEFQREKEQKQLAVLRGLLRKAFPEAEGTEREDCFDKREGVEFLTSEVGLDEGMLPAEGEEIAGLVGYQKLALQMVGNMKSPISRKNRARSWEEIRKLILHLRQEIGID